MKRRFLWCAPWLFVAGIAPAQAERNYATDICSLPVQSGAAPAYKILRMVSSGAPLEIVEPNIQGYTKVKTPEGTVGWIMTQYLMDQPSARSRLAQMETRIAALENENRALRSDSEALNAAREASTRCGEELADVRHTASQTLAIEEENHQLRQEMATSHERQSQLELENATLRDQSRRNWFIAGAGAVSGGLLFGLIVPHLSLGRRRRRWDQL